MASGCRSFMRPGEPAPLVASGLQYGYRRSGQTLIIGNATFEIPAGRIVAIVGANGAGKSTLLKTILGLLRPLDGSLTIGGLTPDAHRQKHGIGYLPEYMNLPGAWTGRGLLAMTVANAGMHAAEDLTVAMDVAGIDFDLQQSVRTMSKGMRQRIALTMALLPLPNLLLLDEPEAGLDPAQRVLLRERIRSFAASSRTVIIASHDVSGICQIADQIYLMRDEKLEPVASSDLNDPSLLLRLFGT